MGLGRRGRLLSGGRGHTGHDHRLDNVNAGGLGTGAGGVGAPGGRVIFAVARVGHGRRRRHGRERVRRRWRRVRVELVRQGFADDVHPVVGPVGLPEVVGSPVAGHAHPALDFDRVRPVLLRGPVRGCVTVVPVPIQVHVLQRHHLSGADRIVPEHFAFPVAGVPVPTPVVSPGPGRRRGRGQRRVFHFGVVGIVVVAIVV